MYAQVEKPKENKSRAVANSVAQNKRDAKTGFGFVDNRPEALVQRRIVEQVRNNPQVVQRQLGEEDTEKIGTTRDLFFKAWVGAGGDVSFFIEHETKIFHHAIVNNNTYKEAIEEVQSKIEWMAEKGNVNLEKLVSIFKSGSHGSSAEKSEQIQQQQPLYRIQLGGTMSNHAAGLAKLNRKDMELLTKTVLDACEQRGNAATQNSKGAWEFNSGVQGMGLILFNIAPNGERVIFHFGLPGWVQMRMR